LQAVYPEHSHLWQEYKPKGYWKDKRNQQQFLDQLAVKLNIRKPEDWYRVTSKRALEEEGGHFIRDYYSGSLVKGN
jgi:hypothetical protein